MDDEDLSSGNGRGAGEDGVDKITKSFQVMSAVLFSVVCVLGVLGNGVVIWATGFRMEKTVSTAWYLNLAVADFLATAVLPFVITETALDLHWPFGGFACKLGAVVFFTNMYASVFTLVVIGVDRCVCVVCPVWTRNHRTVRKASWVSLTVWVLALALSSPYYIFGYTWRDGNKVRCNYDYALGMVVTNSVVGFEVPFSVIVSCYSVIVYRLKTKHSLANQSGRSFKIIGTVVAAFFLCWVPFHVIQLIKVVYKSHVASDTPVHVVIEFGYPISLALALVNSCLNPLLYMFSQGFKDVFRRSILKLLEKAFAEERPQTNNTPTDPDVTLPDIALSETEGSTGPPPRTQDPSGDCPV